MKDIEPFDYYLTTAVKYAHKGQPAEAQWITLNPPTSKNLSQCSDLKQAIFRSLPKEMPKDVKPETVGNASELDASQILAMLYTAENVDLKQVLGIARELFTAKNDVAMIDGETRLTVPVFDDLSIDDIEGMTGEYIARFIWASASRRLSKIS